MAGVLLPMLVGGTRVDRARQVGCQSRTACKRIRLGVWLLYMAVHCSEGL